MSENFKFPNEFIDDQFIPYFDNQELATLVKELGRKVSEKYKGQELVLIGTLKGSICFISDLAKNINGVDITIDFIKLKSVGRTKDSHGSIIIKKDIQNDIKDKHVLLVEDIVDSGRATSFIIDRLKISEPESISIMSLFDKPYSRVKDVELDFVGKKIDDLFIVGYGLDLDDYGRNLKEVYYLKYPN